MQPIVVRALCTKLQCQLDHCFDAGAKNIAQLSWQFDWASLDLTKNLKLFK